MLRITQAELSNSKKMIAKLNKAKNFDLSDAGELIRRMMIKTIDDNRVRDKKSASERLNGKYTKHISEVIDVVVTRDGVAVANQATLDREVPYWALINNGGVIDMKGKKIHGFFSDGSPGAGGITASFKPGPGAPLNVDMSPIAPMNYIEKTGFWVKNNIWKYVVRAMFND